MNDPQVFFRLLPHGADLGPPHRASDLAAGFDLMAAIEAPLTLLPGARVLVPTGLCLELPAGFEAQVRPRSGLALKHGVTVLNAPGTIDADYRGEVGVVLINHGTEPFVIDRGLRIAQLVLARVVSACWIEASDLSVTARGAGGFGSTGLSGTGQEKRA